MHRNIDHAAVPEDGAVVHFWFRDVPKHLREWWLVITPDDADVCDTDPGQDVTVTVNASLRALVQVWRGDVTWPQALHSRNVEIDSPVALRRTLPRWFTLSTFAQVPRPR